MEPKLLGTLVHVLAGQVASELVCDILYHALMMLTGGISLTKGRKLIADGVVEQG